MPTKSTLLTSCIPSSPKNPQQINRILSDHNIEKQICDSRGAVGYLLADVCLDPPDEAGAGGDDNNPDHFVRAIDGVVKESIRTVVIG
ncbi:hypothetical protein HK405_001995 [Cladochytrium tenue]|nr:hypothetical protein HK405_001995 [Cladochytrium tenue]